jgi:hypothetical protein
MLLLQPLEESRRPHLPMAPGSINDRRCTDRAPPTSGCSLARSGRHRLEFIARQESAAASSSA